MICGVILAAGEGRRLRPLTELRPKALCPVGNVPLLDRALDRLADLGLPTAVNACWLADQIVSHVDGRAHVSVEDRLLGTAGGLGKLRDWIDGRAVLVGNADAYLAGADGPAGLLDGWDGATVRVLVVPGPPAEFGTYRFAGFSLLPWSWVVGLRPEPAELVHEVWRPAERAGALTPTRFNGIFRDTGTPADYLAANLHAAGGTDLVADGAVVTGRLDRAVVGAGAIVRGTVIRSVVWPGSVVGPDEHLEDAIRAGPLTVKA